MRLINVHTLKLHTFYNENIPNYVILSHMWLADEEEVTFTQMQIPDACRHMLGFRKIEFLCQQAQQDGYEWAWMDTCAIDKTSSAELSEAINSMFAWYKHAKLCYAYLADTHVEEPSDVIESNPGEAGWLSSRWWSRAWTLQEFLAPKTVIFYDAKWNRIGTKTEKANAIQEKTGIDEETIKDPRLMFNRSVAQRMSWAAKRQATRTEDIAYSLLGLFEINMPLLYGEGARAFVRLQQEILRTVNDQSLFAWGFMSLTLEELSKKSYFPSLPTSRYGLFADMPSRFADCGDIISYHRHGYASDIRSFNGALHLEIPLAAAPQYPRRLRDRQDPGQEAESGYSIGLLPCGSMSKPEYFVGIILARMSGNSQFARERLGSDIFTFLVPARVAWQAQARDIRVGDGRFALHNNLDLVSEVRCSIVLEIKPTTGKYALAGVLPERLRYDDNATIQFPENRNDWPERVAIGLFDARTSILICIHMHMSFSSGMPAILHDKIDKVGEGDVQGKLHMLYRSFSVSFDRRNQHLDKSTKVQRVKLFNEARRVKLFNHIVYTLDAKIPW